MISYSFSECAKLLNAQLSGPDGVFTGLSIDARRVKPGQLFIALPGAKVNGSDFVEQAALNGAVATVVAADHAHFSIPRIVTEPLEALQNLGKLWRARFSPKVIAVTGSNGKTTIKNMLQKIWEYETASSEAVLATRGNLNSEIGLPIMLAELNAKHQIAILEMGMNHFGELTLLSQLAKPEVALIANVGPGHLAGVGGTLAGVAQAKSEIFAGLTENGTGILNLDDPHWEYCHNQLGEKSMLSFALENPKADFRATELQLTAKQTNFQLHTPKGAIPIEMPLLGKHNVMNALAAAATAYAAEASLDALQQGLQNIQATAGRLEFKKSSGGMMLIDDTYNANPKSLEAALQVLANCPKRRILVLGDMRELGDLEFQYHQAAAAMAQEAKVDILYTFGTLTQHTSAAFGEKAMHFQTQESLLHALAQIVCAADTILIKGSRSMEMERIVQALL